MQRRNVVLSLVSVAVASVGCVADSGDEGIYVLRAVVGSETCTATSSEMELTRSHGTLELNFVTSYLIIAQTKSRITASDTELDRRTITATHANVDIEFPDSTVFSDAELTELRNSGLTRFKQLFATPIRPNGSITDVPFNLIPAELVARVAAKGTAVGFGLEAVAKFTIHGTMSGQDVSSQEFSFPVTLGFEAVAVSRGDCPLSGMPNKGYACNPFQDDVLDCCMDKSVNPNGVLTCPAPTM